MTMDTHSKNVCLIGVLHIIAYLIFSVDPLKEAYKKIYYPVSDSDIPHSPRHALATGAYFISMAVLAALMIRGVLKKRHILLEPFLVMSLLFLSFAIFSFFEELLSGFGMYVFYNEDRYYKIGITIMTVYPIYTLYVKLRSETELEKPLKKASPSLIVYA